jgi:hypothetical protein
MAISPPEEPHMRWRSSTGRSSNGQDQHGQQARQPQRGGAVLLVVALRLGPPVDVQRGESTARTATTTHTTFSADLDLPMVVTHSGWVASCEL